MTNALIVGGGISGLAAAIQLERLGIPYTVIERQSALGGVWRKNTYPDARVDMPHHLFQYKFEKRYPWLEYFPAREATVSYLEHVAATELGVTIGTPFMHLSFLGLQNFELLQQKNLVAFRFGQLLLRGRNAGLHIGDPDAQRGRFLVQ